MSVKTLIAMFSTVAATFAAPTIIQAAQEKPTMQTATPKPTKSGHAAVNGVNYYYAVYGTGEPLRLLHGGMELTMPVMLIYGDSDMFRPEHIVKFYQLLGGGLKDAGWQREHMSQNRLAILPNLTHYEMGLAPQLVETALPFLNGEGRPKSWNEQVSAK